MLPRSIESLKGIRKWIKEFAGLPTYIGFFLLVNKYAIDNFLLVAVGALSVIFIYHYFYEYLFPQFDTTGRKNRLALFIVTQAIFWFCIIVFL